MLLNRLLAASALAISSAAMAEGTSDNNAGTVYIPFGAMYYDLDSSKDTDNEVLPQIGVGYQIDEKWATEFIYAEGESSLKNFSGDDDVDVTQMRLSVIRSFSAWKGGFTPYLIGGVGDNDLDPSASGVRGTDDTIITLGGGLKKNLSENWAVRTELLDFHSLDHNQNDYAVSVLFQYHFGGSKAAPAAAAAATPLDSDNDGVADSVDKCPNTAPGAAVDKDGCALKLDEKVQISLSVHFDTDSAEVKPEYYSEIEEVADFLEKYSKTSVTVEGHTDSRGAAAYNKDLSQRRADAIRDVLINEYKVDASRVSSIGFGEEQPVANNDTREGQYQNRRVVAVFENAE